MSNRTVTIGSRLGLHARPAATFSQAVAAAGVPVTLGRPGGTPVNAASTILLMTLALRNGEEVVVTVDGDDAILDELAALLERDLDAEAEAADAAAAEAGQA